MTLKRNFATLVALTTMASATPAAHAQFNFGNDAPAVSATPWESMHLNPKVRVTLDFRNAGVDSVLHMLSKASGITIIKDPTLIGGLTLQSPKPQSLNDAFAMLNAVLSLKNFDLTQQGNFLVIKAHPQNTGRGGRGSFGTGTNPFSGFSFPGGTNTGSNPFGGGGPNLRVYTIKYASASAIAKVINDVFANVTDPAAAFAAALAGAGNPNGAAATGNQGFGGRGGRGNRGGGGNTNTTTVKASSDDYSNSLIVNAPSSMQTQISDLISQIDKPTQAVQSSRVFKLQFAAASDLVTVIQNLLTANAPTGRGSTTASTTANNGGGGNPFNRFFGGGGGNNNRTSANSGGSVVAEPRTNTLLVTAPNDTLTLVGQVLQQLDKPIQYADNSFVVVLKNARADVVANLLNQSFSGRAGTTTTNTNGTNGTSTNRTSTSSTSARSGSTTPASLSSATTTNRATNTGTTNSNYGGNTTSRSTTQTATNGLDSNGQVVTVRDLTGQVIAVPDINTNSLIIVTAPGNRAIVQNIIDQIDKIPEQVMIETLVVEANLDTTDKMGVEFGFNQGKPFGITGGVASGGTSFGLGADASQPQGLRYTLNAGEYSVFLTAVKTDRRFEVLSTPRIFTSNNSTASINISQSLPYVTDSRIDANGNSIFNYAFLDVGIVLTVTPRIASDGYVTMDVTQTANDFVGYTSFNAPIVNQREASTTVSISDGQTVVLGGIINTSITDTVNKVPVLGDIPLLGNLFRSKNKVKSKTELLVFLTPRVVRDATEAQKLREETEKELAASTQAQIPGALRVVTSSPTPANAPNPNTISNSTKPLIPGATPQPTPSGVLAPTPQDQPVPALPDTTMQPETPPAPDAGAFPAPADAPGPGAPPPPDAPANP